jgi:hypothetical protein
MSEVHIIAILLIISVGIFKPLNRWLGKKENTDANPAAGAMNWEKFILMENLFSWRRYLFEHKDCPICWCCFNEQHEDCGSSNPDRPTDEIYDCQCINEVCTEIRTRSVPKI